MWSLFIETGLGNDGNTSCLIIKKKLKKKTSMVTEGVIKLQTQINILTLITGITIYLPLNVEGNNILQMGYNLL